MPRSRRPQRYPSVCFRLAGLLESRSESFSLTFATQREAIDTRQMLYSFAKACDQESDILQRRKDLANARRYRDLFAAMGRWSLSLDPSYNKDNPISLDLPARLHFTLIDTLPRNSQLSAQLDALERQGPSPPTSDPLKDILDALSAPVPSPKDGS